MLCSSANFGKNHTKPLNDFSASTVLLQYTNTKMHIWLIVFAFVVACGLFGFLVFRVFHGYKQSIKFLNSFMYHIQSANQCPIALFSILYFCFCFFFSLIYYAYHYVLSLHTYNIISGKYIFFKYNSAGCEERNVRVQICTYVYVYICICMCVYSQICAVLINFSFFLCFFSFSFVFF